MITSTAFFGAKRCFAARSVAAITPQTQQLLTPSTIRLFSATSASSPEITLYQYAICPYCNIVKAVMSYADMKPTKIVEVNPLLKTELKWTKDYKKVPVMTMDGEQVNGSEEIVAKILKEPSVASFLEKKLQKVTPEEFMESPESKKWIAFAKDDLASLLYPYICRTWNDSYKAFEYVKDVDTFSSFQKAAIQNVGSLAMYFAASKIKQKRNITDERQALNEALIQLEEEGLSGGRQYLSGTEDPNLGDISVYGVLRSIEGLPAHKEVMEGREESSPLPGWYQRMKSQMNQE